MTSKPTDRLMPDGEIRAALGTADHWCPNEGQEATFGNRARAEALLEIPYLRGQKGLTGKGVNVVIVDQGVNAQRLGAKSIEGWQVGDIKPGTTEAMAGRPHGGHGMLVAQNIRAVAPEVTFFDLPMLPLEKITDVPKFFNDTANEAFKRMLDDIAASRKNGKWPGHWVIVNAWAIYDTTSDREGRQHYANNPDHRFNQLVERAVNENHDVVFGAGNCGEFCADGRCGPRDRGPGRSILGANGHPKVLTVGAVRSDAMWLGYSSQGPGQPAFGSGAAKKPDLCAPSNFVQDDDAGTANGGTSTACALAAGVIAALRSRWNSISPASMKATLNETATPVGTGWNDRTGHGVLNARAAYDRLSSSAPAAAAKAPAARAKAS